MVWAGTCVAPIAVMSTAKMKQMGFIPRTRRIRVRGLLAGLAVNSSEGMAVHLAIHRQRFPGWWIRTRGTSCRCCCPSTCGRTRGRSSCSGGWACNSRSATLGFVTAGGTGIVGHVDWLLCKADGGKGRDLTRTSQTVLPCCVLNCCTVSRLGCRPIRRET